MDFLEILKEKEKERLPFYKDDVLIVLHELCEAIREFGEGKIDAGVITELGENYSGIKYNIEVGSVWDEHLSKLCSVSVNPDYLDVTFWGEKSTYCSRSLLKEKLLSYFKLDRFIDFLIALKKGSE